MPQSSDSAVAINTCEEPSDTSACLVSPVDLWRRRHARGELDTKVHPGCSSPRKKKAASTKAQLEKTTTMSQLVPVWDAPPSDESDAELSPPAACRASPTKQLEDPVSPVCQKMRAETRRDVGPILGPSTTNVEMVETPDLCQPPSPSADSQLLKAQLQAKATSKVEDSPLERRKSMSCRAAERAQVEAVICRDRRSARDEQAKRCARPADEDLEKSKATAGRRRQSFSSQLQLSQGGLNRRWETMLACMRAAPTHESDGGCALAAMDSAKSQFSTRRVSVSRGGPRVFALLSDMELGKLERWCRQHVRRVEFYASKSKRAEVEANSQGRDGARRRALIESTAIVALVRKQAGGKIRADERDFLMEKLKTFELLESVPSELLPAVAKQLKVCQTESANEIFHQGQAVLGIHILLYGEVELKAESDAQEGAALIPSVWLSSGAAILQGDYFEEHSQSFLPLPEDRRRFSRTAVAKCDDDDPTVSVVTLMLPLAGFHMIRQHFRDLEDREKVELLTTFVASTLKLAPQALKRNCDLFELEVKPKSDVLLQQNLQPSLKQARMMLLIEGQVHLMRLKKSSKSRHGSVKELVGRGYLLGEASLYGEPFPHYAICVTARVKFMSFRTADYLEKLLYRSAILERPLASSDDGRGAALPAKDAEAQDVVRELAEQAREHARGAAFSASAKGARVARDAQQMRAVHWKSATHRSHVPRARPPAAASWARSRAVAAPLPGVSRAAPKEVECYPNELDLFPSVLRAALASEQSTTTLGSACTPESTELSRISAESSGALQLLDARVARKTEDAHRLAAVHRAHAEHGVHVEDADGGPSPLPGPRAWTPGMRLATPVPGAALLLSCGAVALGRKRRCAPLERMKLPPTQAW